jgi:nucleoside-diphosphate-sugar epimerase
VTEPSRNDRSLVTGGAGFIGSHLATALLSRGDRVRILDDLSSGHRRNLVEGAEFIEGSVVDEAAVRAAAAGCGTIFHLAAEVSVPRTWEDPERAFRVNLEGTERVFRIAGESGARSVVFASSAAVYGPAPSLPSKEGDPFDCASPYAAHKASGELLLQSYARRYGYHAASLRFFNVFGPRQDPKSAYAAVISAFMDAAAADRRPIVFGDLLATLSKVSDRDLDPEFRPPRAGDVPHSCASVEKAQRELGYAPPTSFEEGLAATWRWASAAMPAR